MLTKKILAATAVLTILSSCSISRRWEGETPNEANVAFQLESGVPIVVAAVNNVPARLIISTGRPKSALSAEFRKKIGQSEEVTLLLGKRTSATIIPETVDLRGLADGIIGIDVLGTETVTLDYRRRLLILSRTRLSRAEKRFREIPLTSVRVDGRVVNAEVDSAFPDTLILSGDGRSRTSARVAVAGIDVGEISVGQRPIATAILGSGLLSRLLVSIDYPLKRIRLEEYQPERKER